MLKTGIFNNLHISTYLHTKLYGKNFHEIRNISGHIRFRIIHSVISFYFKVNNTFHEITKFLHPPLKNPQQNN